MNSNQDLKQCTIVRYQHDKYFRKPCHNTVWGFYFAFSLHFQALIILRSIWLLLLRPTISNHQNVLGCYVIPSHLKMWNLKMISDLCWSKKLILHLCKSFYVNINGFWSLLRNITKPVHSECFWPLLVYAVKVMSIYINFSQKTTVKTEKGQEVLKLSPLPKRAKRTYLAMEKDKEVIGYVVPVFRARWVMGGNPQ